MGEPHHARSRHARRSRVGGGVVGIALAAVALIVVGGVVGFVVGRTGSGDAVAASGPQPASTVSASGASAPTAGRPTLLGQVTRVASGDEIMVRIGEAEEAVRVLGLDTPSLGTDPGSATAQCGSREALAYADRRLTDQMVTLVPDPTIPERDERGARLAYVVLRSQLNYTDAALRDGIGRADGSRPLWYADVFAREQTEAVDADRGMWGAPCNAEP